MPKTITQIGTFSYFDDSIIGKGSTGIVYKGIKLIYLGFFNKNKLPVAIKVINLKEINTPVKRHLLNC
jgi:serine/threonine protein kinase